MVVGVEVDGCCGWSFLVVEMGVEEEGEEEAAADGSSFVVSFAMTTTTAGDLLSALLLSLSFSLCAICVAMILYPLFNMQRLLSSYLI